MSNLSRSIQPTYFRLTHGRHCKCFSCFQQDWSEPQLAPCGMHGASCPGVYDPYDAPIGSYVDANGKPRTFNETMQTERGIEPIWPTEYWWCSTCGEPTGDDPCQHCGNPIERYRVELAR